MTQLTEVHYVVSSTQMNFLILNRENSIGYKNACKSCMQYHEVILAVFGSEGNSVDIQG